MDMEFNPSDYDGFEWDDGNQHKSVHKHRVSIEETEQIFLNQSLFVYEDIAHSKTEQRYRVLGKTNTGRLLHASFTLRSNLIRIISARPMNKKEREFYEVQN